MIVFVVATGSEVKAQVLLNNQLRNSLSEELIWTYLYFDESFEVAREIIKMQDIMKKVYKKKCIF